MNIFFVRSVFIIVFGFMSNIIHCVPVTFPQFTQRQRQVNGDGYQTAITAGVIETDPNHDCFEAAVNGGLAARPDIGADLKFAGISSGGIRCKHG